MASYVLIHGAGSDSWYWHLVVPELRARGHLPALSRPKELATRLEAYRTGAGA